MEVETSIAESRQGKHYVYTLAYPDGRVFYVGKGTGNRVNEHELEAKSPRTEYNPYKCNVIRKIWASHEQVQKAILAHFSTEQDAFLYEIALIFFMRECLTNLTDGGEGTSGLIFSEETRHKLSEVHKGRTHSEEHKRKIGEAHTGRVFSQETRRKFSEARKRRVISEETRRKMSKIGKGRTHSEETRRKIGESNRTRVLSEETRRKMSEAAIRRYHRSTSLVAVQLNLISEF